MRRDFEQSFPESRHFWTGFLRHLVGVVARSRVKVLKISLTT